MSQRYKVLLIDDNRDFRDVLSRRLSAQEFDVCTAGSGQAGLAAAMQERFDLILLDMLMPQQDGIATYQELRAHPQTRTLPVILLTAIAVENHWEPMPYETDGLAFIMGKPYDYTVLVDRIRQVLGGKSTEGPGDDPKITRVR